MLLCSRINLRTPCSSQISNFARAFSNGIVLASYHPSFVRIFSNHNTSNSNSQLSLMYKHTKEIVNAWSKHAHKDGKWRNYLSDRDRQRVRITIGKCLESIHSLTTDAEWDLLCSLLCILSPNSEKTWTDFDRYVLERLPSLSTPTALLAATTLLNAAVMLKFKEVTFVAPQVIGRMLVEQKWSGITSSDNIILDIERLGLTLQLLAHSMPLKAAPTVGENYEFLASLVSSATALITSASADVPFSTWKYIWKYAPLIDLPDSKEFYRILYQRVMDSVAARPLQLLYQEEAVMTLFDSMIQSKYKHSDLIQKVSEEMLYRGFDYPKIGLKMFSALLELGAVPLASSVLNNLMKVPSEDFGSETNRLEYKLDHSLKSGSFKLTNTACDRVYHLLKNNDTTTPTTTIKAVPLTPFEASQLARKNAQKQYRSADLILALLCFNRKDKHSDHLHLMESIEIDFITRRHLFTLPVMDVVSIFNVYALLGRNNPMILRQVDEVLGPQLSTFVIHHWQTVLWACARLNHCPVYLDAMIVDYFAFLKGMRVLDHRTMHLLCKSLWSMAVLQKVRWHHIEQVRPLLEGYVMKSDRGWEMDPNACMQLAQVQTELSCQPASVDTAPEKVMELNAFLSKIAVKERVRRRLKESAVSSYTHLEASRILKELGIGHEIEKVLFYGYIADIFIPPSKNRGKVPATPFLGTVIELNGPFHYDTYLRMPLGSGSMKIRHLSALGYDVVALPYWEYKAAMPMQLKKNILANATKNV